MLSSNKDDPAILGNYFVLFLDIQGVRDGLFSGIPTVLLGGAEIGREKNVEDVSADIHALGVLADVCFQGNAPWRWNRLIRRATSSIPGQRFKSAKAFERAIVWRFAMEGVIIVTSILALIIATMSLFAEQRRVQKNAGNEATTNTSASVRSGTATNSADEWL